MSCTPIRLTAIGSSKSPWTWRTLESRAWAFSTKVPSGRVKLRRQVRVTDVEQRHFDWVRGTHRATRSPTVGGCGSTCGHVFPCRGARATDDVTSTSVTRTCRRSLTRRWNFRREGPSARLQVRHVQGDFEDPIAVSRIGVHDIVFYSGAVHTRTRSRSCLTCVRSPASWPRLEHHDPEIPGFPQACIWYPYLDERERKPYVNGLGPLAEDSGQSGRHSTRPRCAATATLGGNHTQRSKGNAQRGSLRSSQRAHPILHAVLTEFIVRDRQRSQPPATVLLQRTRRSTRTWRRLPSKPGTRTNEPRPREPRTADRWAGRAQKRRGGKVDFPAGGGSVVGGTGVAFDVLGGAASTAEANVFGACRITAGSCHSRRLVSNRDTGDGVAGAR